MSVYPGTTIGKKIDYNPEITYDDEKIILYQKTKYSPSN